MDGESVPSFCHSMSCAMTPMMRDQIAGPVPIVMYRKDKPRSGASLIASVTQFASTLENVAAMTMPTDKAEMQKTITTFFDSGAPNAFIDNMPRVT